jgi:hypothetical protein
MRVLSRRNAVATASAAPAPLFLTLPGEAQTIQLEDSAFKIIGWKIAPLASAADRSSILMVYAGGLDTPPMIGTHTVESDQPVFHPRFPLAAGVHYRVIFQPSRGAPGSLVRLGRSVPRPRASAVKIYPSVDVLPSNTLRMYIELSAPMNRCDARKHISMLDGNGKELPEPFLVIEQEPRDPPNQRLTRPSRLSRLPDCAIGGPLEADSSRVRPPLQMKEARTRH